MQFNIGAMRFRRAWAALRHDECRAVNKKKIGRLWREEGLQARVRRPSNRAGISSVPPLVADVPKVVWAIDFQFDSTLVGKAVSIASMLERTHLHVGDQCRRAVDHR